MILAVNYYEILELSRTASQDEVKAAYKKMAAVVHPDKGGSTMLFRLVQEAYEVLSDPVKRKQLDSDLAGPSSGNRQSGSQNNQQQQSHTSQSEPNYIRVEDAYKRWKESRDRVNMPRSESSAAGGVRKMIRESVPFFYMDDDIGGSTGASCSNCGYMNGVFEHKRSHPLLLKDLISKRDYVSGDNIGVCERCKKARGILREVHLNWNENKWLQEAISIDLGDLLVFVNAKFLNERISFGYVVEGSARNEYGLRKLKVLDEYSGQQLSPNSWSTVWGHWKSNDIMKNRTVSMRNWSL